MRRILRIWPLYYLMVIVGFFLFPVFLKMYLPTYPIKIDTNFSYYLTLYIILLPNLDIGAPLIRHFWSIGAEEQFYLFWPILIKVFRNTYYICISIILIYYILLIVTYFKSEHAIAKSIFRLLYYSRFDGMAIGGMFGAALFYKHTIFLNIATSKTTIKLSILIFIILYFIPFISSTFSYSIYAVLFAILIINVAVDPNILKSLKSNTANYLGRISYGLYIFHPLAIISVVILIKDFIPKEEGSYLFFAITLACSGALTVVLASLSFYFFERYLLKLKPRFTVIPSNEQVKKRFKQL